MDRIRVLPDNVANQIAAGEVVGRPASVVKELMENAVDAGATSVTVSFRGGGKESITVIDNGAGMSENDARMAFERHATSKIASAADLFRLHSFGFRGEALPSISSVSELEVVTRREGSELATKVSINGGTFAGQEYTQAPKGTQFTVRNLFYNTPARRRFLKADTVEARHVTTEFQRVALSYPEVAFSLFNNDVPVYQLPASNLRQRIVGVHGRNISGNLLEVSADTSIVKFEGFTGQPSAAKKTNREQYLFVNGRYFRSGYLHKAVMQAYEKLVAAETQPSYFLYMTIDPEKVDVNVHPQKTEVRFEDEQAIWQIFNAAVRESLGRFGVVPMMDFEIDETIDIPVFNVNNRGFKIPDTGFNPDFNPFTEEGSPRRGAGAATPGGGAAGGGSGTGSGAVSYLDDMTEFRSRTFDIFEEGLREFESGGVSEPADRDLIEYITGESHTQGVLDIDSGAVTPVDIIRLDERHCLMTVGGMIVVADIARMHYRVLYERYMAMLGNNSAVSQQLLFSETVEFGADDHHLLHSVRQELAVLGFSLEFRDGGTIEITGTPPELSPALASSALEEIAARMRGEGVLPAQQRLEDMAAVMARKAALSPGVRVPDQAVAPLARELMACGNFSFTPSGQNIITTITVKEIEQRLK